MSDVPSPKANPLVRLALATGIRQGVFLFVLAVADLEYGDLWQVAIRSSAAFWTGAVLVTARRRSHPTTTDLFYFRWGFWIVCTASVFITKLIWSLRGFHWLRL